MLNRTTKFREERTDGDTGFTLIELLVVVVIIGILIAIAIPLYLNYQKGANDKAAQSDARGAVSALEQCNTDNQAYPSAGFSLGASGAAGTCSQAINVSAGTSLQYVTPSTATGATANSYVITVQNTKGSSKVYCYDSSQGGQVTAPATAVAMGVSKCS